MAVISKTFGVAALMTICIAGCSPQRGNRVAAVKPTPRRTAGYSPCKPGDFPISCAALEDYTEAITQFDLVKSIGLTDRVARIHYSVLGPGGIVPQHPHKNRPCVEYILEGTATETKRYDDGRVVVRRIAQDEIEIEGSDITHWWKNETKGMVRMIAVDIFNDPTPTFWRPTVTVRTSAFSPPTQSEPIKIEDLGQIDLATEYPTIPAAKGYVLRSRRITLYPHQRTQVYSTKASPSYAYVVKGDIIANRADREPEVSRPEEFLIFDGDTLYFFDNPTSKVAVIWTVEFEQKASK